MSAGRLIRFGLVGVVNTGVYYVLYLLLRMVMPYLVAHVVATLLAMVGSYFLNCYVTFKTRPSWRTFITFPLSNVANLLFTTLGLRIAVEWLGLDQRIAPLPVALCAIPITYVVASYIMLPRSQNPTEGAAHGDRADQARAVD